jgi:bis(5'-nucleosidyl)-tetraphosphatase
MIKEISYGLVLIRDGKALLLRAYDTWDFPKGKPNDGESPMETAIRETYEETSLSDIVFTWGKDFVETLPYKRGKKVARFFFATCPTGDVKILPNPESGVVEHHGFDWIPVQHLGERLKERHAPVLNKLMETIEYGKV